MIIKAFIAWLVLMVVIIIYENAGATFYAVILGILFFLVVVCVWVSSNENKRKAIEIENKKLKEEENKINSEREKNEASKKIINDTAKSEIYRIVTNMRAIADNAVYDKDDPFEAAKTIGLELDKFIKHNLFQKLDVNKTDNNVQIEVNMLLKRLNQLGLGEDIIFERVMEHLKRH